MTILRKLYEFNLPKCQLVHIYTIFIRVVLEQSSVVWSSSITEEESNALERAQKIALRIIYKNQYKSYTHALNDAKLSTLKKRREDLLLKFAIKCVNNPKTAHMIPKNQPDVRLRNPEKYKIQHARTNRLANSPINAMAHLLNKQNNLSI